MVLRLKSVMQRLARILDSEVVVFFQVIVYILHAIGGIYGLFIARSVPPSVAAAFGSFRPGDTLLLWLFVGMPVCLVGKVVLIKAQRVWKQTTGLWMQLIGDACAFGGFTVYVVASVQSAIAGTTEAARLASGPSPMVATYGYGAYATCAFFLCVRDVRRIRQAEKAVRA